MILWRILLTGFVTLAMLLSSNLVWAAVSGTVYRDLPVNGSNLNAYGVKDANELGVAGVTVTVTDSSGAVVGTPATTDASGNWSVAGTSGNVRVAFSNIPSYLKSSPVNTGSNTTVQFISDGATANLGLHDPADYSDTATPDMLVPVFRDGNAVVGPWIAENGMALFQYDDTGITHTFPAVATHAEKGSVWGVAYQKSTSRAFASAFLKRHVGFGPKDVGGIYMFEASGGSMALTGSFSLQGVTSSNGVTIDFGSVTRVDSPGGNDNYLGSGGASRDMDAYGKVGKVSYGDIDFAANGKLYLVNTNTAQRSIISMDVSSATTSLNTASSATLGALTEVFLIDGLSGLPSCTNGSIRPFALKFHQGRGYLGVVCDGSSDNKFTISNVKAHVLSFDPENIAAGFTSEIVFDNFDYRNGVKRWTRWSDTWADTRTGTNSGSYTGAQPVLSDIEFAENGDMIVGFMDRFGHQMGSANYLPESGSTELANAIAYGDILHVCRNGLSWEIEGTGSCPTYHTTAGNLLNDYSGNTVGSEDTTGAGEYYNDAQGDLDGPNAPFAGEASNGALAVLMGSNQVVSTVMDPFPPGADGDFATYGSTGGLHWFNQANGNWDNHLRLYDSSTTNFRKSHGIGDVELLTPPAPLEIGNRVWLDTDGDGVQDAGEAGISGVNVELRSAGGSVLATVTTAADGTYYFSNASGTDVTGKKYGVVQLQPNTAFTLHFPTTTASYSLTSVKSGSNTLIDSDAAVATGDVVVAATDIPAAGANNHSFDVGYTAAASPPSLPPPVDVCSATSFGYAMPQYRSGDSNVAGSGAAESQALLIFPNNATGNLGSGGTNLNYYVEAGDVGSVWGTAVHTTASSSKVYMSAFLKRHVSLGPNGLGAIYVTDTSGAVSSGAYGNNVLAGSKFVDLVSDFGINVGQSLLPASRGLSDKPGDPSLDAGVFPLIGKIGLGDLDFDETFQNLFVVNLYDKKVYKINVASGASGTPVAYTIPGANAVANAEMRPFGLEIAGGKLYAGVVYSPTDGNLSNLKAAIYQLDLATGSWAGSSVLEFSLNYPRPAVDGDSSFYGTWNPWQDDYAQWKLKQTNGSSIHPQPVLSDMEMDAEGAIHIALFDRVGHQMGSSNLKPDGSGQFTSGIALGDLLRTSNNSGTLSIENNGVAGSYTSVSGQNNNEGPGGGEFYWNDAVPGDHVESVHGGIAWYPPANTVAASNMNPTTNTNSGGMKVYNTTNGTAVQNYQTYSGGYGAYGKAAGVGDIELLCERAPVVTTGNLSITKNVTGGTDPQTFSLQLDCSDDAFDDPGIQLTAGQTHTVNNIPTGTTCTVTETTPTPPSGYNYGAPVITPSQPVTIGNGTTVAVTVENPLTQGCLINSPTVSAVCNNNGTPTDPNDDRFSYSISASGVAVGSTYSISGGDSRSGLAYNTTHSGLGDFPISGGNLSLTLTDAATATCNLANVTVAAPATCSSTVPQTDLKLLKTASKTTVSSGETLTYTLTLSNESTVDATGVQVTDNLPTGVTLVSSNPSQGTFSGGVWNVGTVTAGATVTMTIDVTVD